MTKTDLKKIGLLLIALLALSTLAFADSGHETEIEAGRQLVESGVACDELTEEQLEEIGEYLMEQMHPGEAHDAMHEMMGIEEGSEYHMQAHVSMARTLYCGEGTMMGSGGMMGQGMMGNNIFGSGMPFLNYGYWSVWNILYALLLVGLVALVFLGAFKFWKDVNKK